MRDAASGAAVSVRKRDLKKRKQKKTKKQSSGRKQTKQYFLFLKPDWWKEWIGRITLPLPVWCKEMRTQTKITEG